MGLASKESDNVGMPWCVWLDGVFVFCQKLRYVSVYLNSQLYRLISYDRFVRSTQEFCQYTVELVDYVSEKRAVLCAAATTVHTYTHVQYSCRSVYLYIFTLNLVPVCTGSTVL